MMGWWSFSLAALSARVVVGTTWRGACIVPRTDSEGQDYFFQDGRGDGAAAEGTMWLRRVATIEWCVGERLDIPDDCRVRRLWLLAPTERRHRSLERIVLVAEIDATSEVDGGWFVGGHS